MALSVLIASCTIISFFEFKKSRTFLTPFNILSWPFVLLILLNNVLATHLGFFDIKSITISQFIVAFLMFAIGMFFFTSLKKDAFQDQRVTPSPATLLTQYRINWIFYYVLIVETTAILKVILIVVETKNMFSLENNLLGGVVGHMLLTTYPLVPLLLYSWLKDKKKFQYILLSIIAVSIMFLTGVKYHVITMIGMSYFFIMLLDKEYQRIKYQKIILIFVPTIFILFSLYYVMTYFLGNNPMDMEFLLNHFWKYLAGGVINNNELYTGNIHTGTMAYNLISFLTPLPNMFLNKFFHIQIFTYKILPNFSVNHFSEKGNVINTIGQLYGTTDNIFAPVVMICFGFLCYGITYLVKKNFTISSIAFLSSFYTFLFLSFFSPFWVLSVPWEIMIFSMIIPFLFRNKTIEMGTGFIKRRWAGLHRMLKSK